MVFLLPLAIMSPDLRLGPYGADCFGRMGGRWKPTASTGTAPFTCMKLSQAESTAAGFSRHFGPQ